MILTSQFRLFRENMREKGLLMLAPDLAKKLYL